MVVVVVVVMVVMVVMVVVVVVETRCVHVRCEREAHTVPSTPHTPVRSVVMVGTVS